MGLEPAPPEDWEEVPTQVQLGWLGGGVPEPSPDQRLPGEGVLQIDDRSKNRPERSTGLMGLPGKVDERMTPNRPSMASADLRDRMGFIESGPTSVRTAPSPSESGWNPLNEPVAFDEGTIPRPPTPEPSPNSFAGRRSLAYRRPVPAPTPLRHKKRDLTPLPDEVVHPPSRLQELEENLRSQVRKRSRWEGLLQLRRMSVDPTDLIAFGMVFASTLVLGTIAIWLLMT